MNKSKYKVYNGKRLKEIFMNSRLIFLVIFFSAGIFFGASLIKDNTEIFEKISEICSLHIKGKNGQGIGSVFLNSFGSSFIFEIINIFLAFSLIGYPFILLIPFVKALGIGAVTGYLYFLYRSTGLGYCIMTIYPGAIVSAFSLILACNESCEYSKNAFNKAIKGRGQFEKDETKLYFIRQFILTLVCVASAAIDAVFSVLFSGFFEI